MSSNDKKLYDLEKKVRKMQTIENHGDVGDAYAQLMLLHELRALWPFSSVNESGTVYDVSGQGRHLSNSNVNRGRGAVCPYVIFNGSSSQLARVTEGGLNIGGAVTLGGWFYFTTAGTNIMAMSKDGAIGQFSYHLQKLAGGTYRFQISSDGTATTVVDSTVTPAINTWNFVVGRYYSSSEMKIWVNDASIVNTTSIPASVFSSTANFALGTWPGGGPARWWPGNMSLCFLCAGYNDDTYIARLFNSTRWIFGV